MAIGYACKVVALPDAGMKGILLKNVSEELLNDVIAHNLNALEKMVDYNISKGIQLFRISSDIIPFGSHEVNTMEWWKSFGPELYRLGEKIKASAMRVSMHPGQYTVLNSPDKEVVSRSIQDLLYHARFLDALGVDSSNKLILHIGGLYGDKLSAAKRFVENWSRLPEQIKKRLVIENDEKCFNVGDVLQIGMLLGIPVVFDNLHNSINPAAELQLDAVDWIKECKSTWGDEDGRQKIHYSQQNPKGQRGAHSDTIYIRAFMEFYREVRDLDPDIMLEVKDKNISALKCLNCTGYNVKRAVLETEWAAYKYAVMERSYRFYKEISGLFSGEEQVDPISFYEKLEEALAVDSDLGNAINTAEHVWGYFKAKAEAAEKRRYEKLLGEARKDSRKLQSLKRFLFKLTRKYDEKYLMGAYYFTEV